MIEVKDKTKCTGCAACAGVCPTKCVEMIADKEGFYYPQIDRNNCIDCHLCEKRCPVINATSEVPFFQKGFIVQNKDEIVLRESTAGGFFTALAQYVINKNGKVFGVTIDNENLVHHVCVDRESELWKFRNSKYVQSYLDGAILKEVKKSLELGELVLFSGTPCQVEGLKNVVGDQYQNLITVDVVCRAVPSPLIFKKYIEYQEKHQGGSIRKIIFRDKEYGYKYSTLKLVTEQNNGNYHRGVESDPWLRAFFSGAINRPSCYHCHFRKRYRVSDFTIWDCFQVGRFSKDLDNDKGATRVLIHTQKGNVFFEQIKSALRYVEVEPDSLVETTHEMFYSLPEPDKKEREQLFLQANELLGEDFFEKHYPYDFRVNINHFVRMFCLKVGIYSFLKKIYVRIINKY